MSHRRSGLPWPMSRQCSEIDRIAPTLRDDDESTSDQYPSAAVRAADEGVHGSQMWYR